MLRIWLAMSIIMAGLPRSGAVVAGAPGCPGVGCCAPAVSCCAEAEAQVPHCSARAEVEPCPCMRPARPPEPRPDMPLPHSGPHVTLSAPEATQPIALGAPETGAGLRHATWSQGCPRATHNETQAQLGIWRT